MILVVSCSESWFVKDMTYRIIYGTNNLYCHTPSPYKARCKQGVERACDVGAWPRVLPSHNDEAMAHKSQQGQLFRQSIRELICSADWVDPQSLVSDLVAEVVIDDVEVARARANLGHCGNCQSGLVVFKHVAMDVGDARH